MKILTLLLLVLIFCMTTSCKKDDGPDNSYGLPDATQTGENTFGCLINGEPWIAEIGLGVIDPTLRELDMNYDETDTGIYYNNNWSMRAKSIDDSIHDSFTFTARNFDSATSLNRQNNKLTVRYGTNQQLFNVYRIDTLQYFNVEITTLDTLNNICSGLFNFVVISDDFTDTLHITEGRFDKFYSQE